MIRTPLQRACAHLLRQMTSGERASFRRLRRQGRDWPDAFAFGVILPDIATGLAAFQARGSRSRLPN